MRILLVGNGIEIRYNKQMTISSIIRKMNSGDKIKRTLNIKKNLTDFYNNNLAEKYGKMLLNDTDFEKIADVVNDDIKGLSVEQIFNSISTLLINPEKIKQIKLIFLEYIDRVSDSTPVNNLDRLQKTLCDYEVILTTNYTHIIERILESVDEGKPHIIHLHGDYKTDKDRVLLGLEKENSKKNTRKREWDELDKSSDSFIKHQWDINNKEKISIDVFGMSFNNDENILGNIYGWIMTKVFSEKIGELSGSNGMYEDETILSYSARSIFKLKYYWHETSDLTAFQECIDWPNGVFKFEPYNDNDEEKGRMLMLLCAIWNKKFADIREIMSTASSGQRYLMNIGMTIEVKCSEERDSSFVRDDGGNTLLSF